VLIFPLGTDLLHAYRDPQSWPDWNFPIARDPSVHEAVRQVMVTDDPGTAAGFLQEQQATMQPFRYAPYFASEGKKEAYLGSLSQKFIAILANARATRLGLEQVPGYSPVHSRYYSEYITAMNGTEQDYHFFDLMAPAVSGSQLLDMLNTRYVLVPANLEPVPIAEFGEVVYQDDLVIVYENPNAYARAWIVHDVQPDQNGAELDLFNTGQVDGHVTAFVHGDLPTVSPPDPNGPNDSTVVTSYEPERIDLTAKSTGDGLLVLSEVYADGWNAWVDGKPVDILRTNHALRGVPLAAGTHDVVLKYEPTALKIGLWSTSLSGLAMIGVWIWALIDRRKYTTGARPL
jgi:hypothetical protein